MKKNFFRINSNELIEWSQLKELLPDVESALWFAKLMKLTADQVGELLRKLFNSSVIEALTRGDHSTELQDYIVDTFSDEDWGYLSMEEVSYDPLQAPPPTVLPQLWEAAITEVAASIQDVADKVQRTLHALPSKEGRMIFRTLASLNSRRPTIGSYKAYIHHSQVPDVLVVLDVSGSMTENTVRTIVDDVVALAWNANAYFSIVSDNTFVWEPGCFDSSTVLQAAEFNGTHYESLRPLFDRDWGSVVTIADYDSSWSAKNVVSQAKGRVGTVFDISLVNRPTFLSEVVGQLAQETRHLMVAADYTRLVW